MEEVCGGRGVWCSEKEEWSTFVSHINLKCFSSIKPSLLVIL